MFGALDLALSIEQREKQTAFLFKIGANINSSSDNQKKKKKMPAKY